MSAGRAVSSPPLATAMGRCCIRRLTMGAHIERPFVRAAVAAVAVVATGALLMVMVCATRASAQRQVAPVGAGRAAAQIGAGALGMPIGFLGGGLATRWAAAHLGASADRASSAAVVGAYVGAAAVTAVGPTLVGGGSRAHGSYFAALAGAAVGGAGSVLLVRLNRANDMGSVLRVISFVGVLMLPSVGATVGYNLSRH
jgi:hypothetical protein